MPDLKELGFDRIEGLPSQTLALQMVIAVIEARLGHTVLLDEFAMELVEGSQWPKAPIFRINGRLVDGEVFICISSVVQEGGTYRPDRVLLQMPGLYGEEEAVGPCVIVRDRAGPRLMVPYFDLPE